MSLLEKACSDGDVDAVTSLLNGDIDVNDASRGATVLAHASKHGHVQVVLVLLKRQDLDVNIGVPKNLSTPLLVAASLGHAEVVRVLIAHRRVDVNKARRDGVTPLMIAVQQSHQDCVVLLCACPRLKVNARSIYPERITALHIAIRANNVEAVTTLLAHPGMDLEENAYMRETPLQIATELGEAHLGVAELIRSYANGDTLQPAISNVELPAQVQTAVEVIRAAESPHEENMLKGMCVSSCMNVNTAEQTLKDNLQCSSPFSISALSIRQWAIAHFAEALLVFQVPLYEGCDLATPVFATSIYAIMLQAGWILASACVKRGMREEANLSMLSASVVHHRSPRSLGLVFRCKLVSSPRGDLAPREDGESDFIQIQCNAEDIDEVSVATLDVQFGVLGCCHS